MANKDLIVKLTADSRNYESNLEKARKSLDKFQKQNQSTDAIMKVATSALTKFVGAAALVKGAQEVIKNTIEGSQGTADAFRNTMDGAKNAVDSFFNALSTGDFTNFNQGLITLITKGREAAEAMDQLGNTIMSYDFLSSKNNTEFQENLLTIRNANSTPGQREAAAQAALGNLTYAEELKKGKIASLQDALGKNATKKSILTADQFSLEDLKKIAELDAFALNPEGLQKAGLQNKEYYLQQADEASALIAAARKEMESQLVNPNYTYMRSEEEIRKAMEEADKTNKPLRDAFAKYQKQIVEQYRFAYEVKAILEDISDEELRNNIFGLAQDAASAEQTYTGMNKQYLQALGEYKRSVSSEPTASAKTTPAKTTTAYDEYSQFVGDYLNSLRNSPENKLQNHVNSMIAKDLNDYQVKRLADRTKELASNAEDINSLASAFGNLGAAMNGAGGNAMSAAASILQAMAVAVPAFETLTASASTAAGAEAVAETPTVAGKIAAAATITASIISMISTLKNVGSYAEGGIIPGHNFTDGITARVSSGEMIINEADQKRLYDSIHSGSYGGGTANSVIRGEDLVTVINNYGRRTGRGEILR